MFDQVQLYVNFCILVSSKHGYNSNPIKQNGKVISKMSD